MSIQDVINDAMVDLQSMLLDGIPLGDAIKTLSEEYGVKHDVLVSRASRPGGVVDQASALKQRAKLVSLVQEYEDQGYIFMYPPTSFEQWCVEVYSHNLSDADNAFAGQLIEAATARARERFQRECLRQLRVITSNDESE